MKNKKKYFILSVAVLFLVVIFSQKLDLFNGAVRFIRWKTPRVFRPASVNCTIPSSNIYQNQTGSGYVSPVATPVPSIVVSPVPSIVLSPVPSVVISNLPSVVVSPVPSVVVSPVPSVVASPVASAVAVSSSYQTACIGSKIANALTAAQLNSAAREQQRVSPWKFTLNELQKLRIIQNNEKLIREKIIHEYRSFPWKYDLPQVEEQRILNQNRSLIEVLIDDAYEDNPEKYTIAP